jgi:hypothetical protein
MKFAHIRKNKGGKMKIKKWYNAAVLFIKAGGVIWICETIFFLFYYGWHWEAIGIEVYFDKVAAIAFLIGFVCWFVAADMMLNRYIRGLNESRNKK